MPAVIFVCLLLVVVTTVIHYEVLRGLSSGLPRLAIPGRSKLLIVILAAFVAHVLEIGLYGLTLFVMVRYVGAGSLSSPGGFSLVDCLYFSAETYTSVGFGDVVPTGPVRLLAGAEALNGLLLIGWSASYAYIAMERFWTAGNPDPRS